MEIKTNISTEDIAIYLANCSNAEQSIFINKFVETLNTVCDSYEVSMQTISIANNLNNDSVEFIKRLSLFAKNKELQYASK